MNFALDTKPAGTLPRDEDVQDDNDDGRKWWSTAQTMLTLFSEPTRARTHTFRGRSRRVSQHAHNVVAVVVFDIKRARSRAHFQLTARRSQRTNADSANQCGVCVAARQQSLCDQDARIIMSTTRFVLHGGSVFVVLCFARQSRRQAARYD